MYATKFKGNGDLCHYRLVVYFHETVIYNGKEQNRRLVMYANLLKTPEEEFRYLQQYAVNLAIRKRNKKGFTFKAAVLYNAISDIEMWRTSHKDADELRARFSAKPAPKPKSKLPFPEEPDEKAIQFADTEVRRAAYAYWRLNGWECRKRPTMGAGVIKDWVKSSSIA